MKKIQELIKVNYLGDDPTVSAKDLHEKLNIETPLKKWFGRMCEYGFVEAKDFWTKMTESTGGRPSTDYDLTIRMAKEICMIQRTDIGREIRQHFLDLEDAWNTPEQVMARALKFAGSTIDGLKERCKFLGGQLVEQQKTIEEMQPKVSYYDLILQCKDLIAVTIIAKDYGMTAIKFNRMLHDYSIQFKQNEVWVLYAKYQGQGYMKMKTHNYADSDGVQHAKEYSYWTQKGRLFLYDFLKQKGIIPLIEQKKVG